MDESLQILNFLESGTKEKVFVTKVTRIFTVDITFLIPLIAYLIGKPG